MSERRYLAFDLGAESGRAMVGTLSDGRLTLEEKHRFLNPNGRMNGHLHWNLLAQWEELKTGLRKCGQAELAGIGVDTWGVDFGFVGRGGVLLGEPYMYRDPRTDGMFDVAFKRVPKKEIFEATGIQFMQINSLFQFLSMRETRNPILDVAETLLFIPDLFNFLFTGQRKCELSIASTSQMYDPRKKTWALDLLKRLDLPTHVFPEIIPPGTILGNLTADVAKECNVSPIPVIAPGSHDTASAVAAVPVEEGREVDWCYISSGTWSLMGLELPEPVINEKSLKYNYTNEVGVGGRIRFLKNIMGLWPVQECRRHWLKEGTELDYVTITKMASDAKPFQSVLNLDHPPFLRPDDMPNKIVQYCRDTKQPTPGGKGEVVRAILESLALSYRRTVEGMQDILGRPIRTIHIVGGGCKNELLNQMTADATGRTVLAGPVEATAAGNVLVQAMATGDIKSLADARAVIRNSFEVKRFDPRDDAKQWDASYARFRELVEAAA